VKQEKKHPVSPLLLLLHLLSVSPNVTGMLADDTVYYDTPARNDSHLLETAYNSIRSFARAKVNNIGVGQQEVGGGQCLGPLHSIPRKGGN
jgi:hypothetical protein